MEMYFKLKLLEEIIAYILVFLVVGFWVILVIFLAIKDKINEIREKRDREKIRKFNEERLKVLKDENQNNDRY